jgi:hypothetical protein
MTISRAGASWIVAGVEAAPIVPDRIQDLGVLRVEIEPGAQLKRGVYCSELLVGAAPFAIGGPVCVQGSVSVAFEGTETGVFAGGLVAGGNVAIQASRARGAARVRVVGDVVGRRIGLRNTVVYGHVLGTEILLEDSIVFGHVTADETLRAHRSYLVSAGAARLHLGDGTLLANAAASADHAIELEGRVCTAALADLAAYLTGHGAWEPMHELTAADIHAASEGGELTVDLFCRVLDLSGPDKLVQNAETIARLIGIARGLPNAGSKPLAVASGEAEDRIWQYLAGE